MKELVERITRLFRRPIVRSIELLRRHPIWVAIGSLIATFLYAAPALGYTLELPRSTHALAAASGDSFFSNLLKVYVPRQYCMYQERSLIWLHVISDAVIAISYYSIPVALIYFVRRRRDLAFNWMFVCFAVFILACGAGHVLQVLAIWHPVYRLEGIVKAITALASIGTAVVLWPLIPKALAIPSPSELKSANRELEAFSYSVSHDLRAPLRHLDGFSQTLLEDYGDKLDAEGQNYLHRIRNASQQMGRLIDDLLNLSRVSRAPLERQKTDLSELAQDVAGELRDSAPNRKVEFVIEDGLTANADPSLLRIVLVNLLGNAWKFTSKHSSARIEFGHANRSSENTYFVRDNGAGFDMTYAGKLFGAFQRLHKTEEFPGTGIGLATVQRIVLRHGGRIWAEGKPGEGAAFYFKL